MIKFIDNASSNRATISMFENSLISPRSGNFYHMKCVCHIINLIMHTGLQKIDDCLEKIRDAIQFIVCSLTRYGEFGCFCESLNLRKRKFLPDVKTRWNSTYLMLHSCVNYDKAITLYYNEKIKEDILTDLD